MMEKGSSGSLTLEIIAQKLSYYQEQLHLFHFQTKSYAEHKALDEIYDFVGDFKDNVIEKIMGYMGRRVSAYTIPPLKNYSDGCACSCVKELNDFAYQLEEFGELNRMCDVENLAQELSGQAAKTLYLLTLK
jgi:hypothetical protein